MAANAKRALHPAEPIAWTLRDEMAMRLAAALIVNGNWTSTNPDGTKERFRSSRKYCETAYHLADLMLIVREE